MKHKTFYITTPIYYPSGNLHIGHVYTTTLAWVLSNYKRMMGYDVKLLTGADEHGQKIQQKAIENNLKPQAYVDLMTNKFKNLWDKFKIEINYFSRTTNPQHKQAIIKQFSELIEKGIIYKGTYKGWYSILDEEFLTVVQANKKDNKLYHPISGHELVEIEEETYFFKMSKFQSWLNDYLKKNPNYILPKKIVNEITKNFLEKGLEDLSVTRSSFTWGIKINEDPKHIVYVWLDALNNYITTLGYNTTNDSDFQKYWVNGDEIVHIVGKEIIRFHGIYWSIILKSLGLRLPTTILSHGWIITSQGKMSKSKGNVINPLDLLKKYDQEVIKYFLVSQIKFGSDGIFDEKRLITSYNANLANNYGNLLSRTIAMIKQNFNVPIKFRKPELNEDIEIINTLEEKFKSFKHDLDLFKINIAFDHFAGLGKSLNQFIDITKPWTLKENKKRLEQVLVILLNGIYAMTWMLNIVMPNKTKIALAQLNLTTIDEGEVMQYNKFDKIMPKTGIVLFPRIK